MEYPEFPGALVINTDGSAFNNGKADAVAGVGVYFGEKDPRNIGRPLGPGKQTNQRAELMAVRLALDSASGHKKVVIRSDSKYAIGCVTDWYYKWKLQSWRKAAGIFRENHHLIESTVHRIQKRKRDGATTGFFWVKGHAGDPGNEAADRLASKGSRRAFFDRRKELNAMRRKGGKPTVQKTAP